MPLAPEPADVRLLILCAGDPDLERTFSGSARSLFQALEGRGCVHAKANVAGYTNIFSRGNAAIRLMRKLDKFGFETHYRWSPVAFARNSRRAVQAAQANPGYNACLMYGTTFNPKLDVPTYCYFDATVAQVRAARQWEFACFSERTANRIQAYQKAVFDHCTGIFPRSRWAARSVEADYRIPPEKVHVAGAGSNHLAEPLPHKAYDGRTILFIGKEFERKGGPLLVEAFRVVRARIPGARLVIVGCSPPIDEPGVEIVGRISKDAPGGLQQLLSLYSEASVFCVMSHYEPFGIVIVEAQNSFVPCVVPARYAFTETVVDGVTGRHVPEYDAGMLAEALTELLSSPEKLEEMGRAAHAHVRANYTWDEAARRIHQQIALDLAGNTSPVAPGS